MMKFETNLPQSEVPGAGVVSTPLANVFAGQNPCYGIANAPYMTRSPIPAGGTFGIPVDGEGK